MMGQERAQIISGIRDPRIIFPPSWPSERDKQHDFIRWLLAHDPSARPNADVALASPLMPMELKEPDQHHKAIFSASRHFTANGRVAADSVTRSDGRPYFRAVRPASPRPVPEGPVGSR